MCVDDDSCQIPVGKEGLSAHRKKYHQMEGEWKNHLSNETVWITRGEDGFFQCCLCPLKKQVIRDVGTNRHDCPHISVPLSPHFLLPPHIPPPATTLAGAKRTTSRAASSTGIPAHVVDNILTTSTAQLSIQPRHVDKRNRNDDDAINVGKSLDGLSLGGPRDSQSAPSVASSYRSSVRITRSQAPLDQQSNRDQDDDLEMYVLVFSLLSIYKWHLATSNTDTIVVLQGKC
jgi:hypothetical protein